MRRRTGPPLDIRRAGRSLAAEGMDLRHWVSWGTVASVGGDDGPDFSDPNAVLITPAGVEVDVVLEPSGYPVTCRYGIQCGRGYIVTPIHPGDQVIVLMPDGSASMVPKIVSIESGSSNPIPVGDDGKPVFQNDRVLVVATGVPIDLRTDGGGRVLIDGDTVSTAKNTKLGGTDADQKIIRGDAYTGDENSMLDTFQSALTAMATASGTAVSLPTIITAFVTLATQFGNMATAVTQFRAKQGHLSDVSSTK